MSKTIVANFKMNGSSEIIKNWIFEFKQNHKSKNMRSGQFWGTWYMRVGPVSTARQSVVGSSLKSAKLDQIQRNATFREFEKRVDTT